MNKMNCDSEDLTEQFRGLEKEFDGLPVIHFGIYKSYNVPRDMFSFSTNVRAFKPVYEINCHDINTFEIYHYDTGFVIAYKDVVDNSPETIINLIKANVTNGVFMSKKKLKQDHTQTPPEILSKLNELAKQKNIGGKIHFQ